MAWWKDQADALAEFDRVTKLAQKDPDRRAKVRPIEEACIKLSCDMAKHGLRLRSFKVSRAQMDALYDAHGRPGPHQRFVITGATGPVYVVERNT